MRSWPSTRPGDRAVQAIRMGAPPPGDDLHRRPSAARLPSPRPRAAHPPALPLLPRNGIRTAGPRRHSPAGFLHFWCRNSTAGTRRIAAAGAPKSPCSAPADSPAGRFPPMHRIAIPRRRAAAPGASARWHSAHAAQRRFSGRTPPAANRLLREAARKTCVYDTGRCAVTRFVANSVQHPAIGCPLAHTTNGDSR